MTLPDDLDDLETLDGAGTEATDWFSDDAATFGDRVAAAREALGMSQEDLARRLGVKFKTVQAWEDDRSEPRANKLAMLSGILNVSLTWLLNGEGDGIDAPVDAAGSAREVEALLIEMRLIKTTLSQSAERLAMIEKRLRRSLREAG